MNREYLLISMLILFEILGLALFAGCGDSSAPTFNSPSTTPITLSMAPYSQTVQVGGTQQFRAIVSPSGANQDVTWSVAGTGCSGASCGTIDLTGTYTAPASVPDPATVTITARLVADPTKFVAPTIAIVAVLGESFSFSMNPTSVAFGNQMVNTTSAPRAVTVTNTGSTPQPVRGRMNGTPGQWQDFASTNDCPSRIAVGARCTFNITFRPSATGGRAGILVVDGTFEEEGFVSLGGMGTN
jgi:Bacterial Ig-like domain (group 2)